MGLASLHNLKNKHYLNRYNFKKHWRTLHKRHFIVSIVRLPNAGHMFYPFHSFPTLWLLEFCLSACTSAFSLLKMMFFADITDFLCDKKSPKFYYLRREGMWKWEIIFRTERIMAMCDIKWHILHELVMWEDLLMIRYLENRILCPVSSTLSLAVLNEKAVLFYWTKTKKTMPFSLLHWFI